MGERCDNFSFAFNGISLDWGKVLGARFDDVPKSWVTVFRETSLEELIYIAREGLSAYHQDVRHPELFQEMEMLDRHRPKKILERGISRIDAISALPASDSIFGTSSHRTVMLELKVDPKECFVSDVDFLNYATPFATGKQAGSDRYKNAFKKYWDSMTPLTHFLKHYTNIELPEGSHWLRREGAPGKLPDMFFMPEVLIMSPTVSAQHIRIAGELTTAAATTDWE